LIDYKEEIAKPHAPHHAGLRCFGGARFSLFPGNLSGRQLGGNKRLAFWDAGTAPHRRAAKSP